MIFCQQNLLFQEQKLDDNRSSKKYQMLKEKELTSIDKLLIFNMETTFLFANLSFFWLYYSSTTRRESVIQWSVKSRG